MKKVAFIYSGDITGLDSLEHNRNGVAKKLKNFGGWEIGANKQLDSELTFIKDIKKYQNDEIDSLLIYYTGHGEMPEPYKTFQVKISDEQGIPLKIFYEKIFQCFTKDNNTLPLKVAIVLDACYSGDTIYKAEQFGTSEIVASSLADKYSFEKGFPKDKNGNQVKSDMSLFSHYFCEAIESLQSIQPSVNLLNIRNYINGKITLQTSPYSFKSIYDENSMTIAKGSFEYQYKGDIASISIYFEPSNNDDNSYSVIVNNDTITEKNITLDDMKEESIHKKIIEKIEDITKDIEKDFKPKIDVFLPQEAYGIVFPLWEDALDAYTVCIRSYSKLQSGKKIIKEYKDRWNVCYPKYKNMSHGHKDVSVISSNKAKLDIDRISLIIDKCVKENAKVYQGLDKFYFIAVWIKEESCQDDYIAFLSDISKTPLSNLSKDVDKKIVDSDGGCIEKLSFMWDDPNNLPKQGRRKE